MSQLPRMMPETLCVLHTFFFLFFFFGMMTKGSKESDLEIVVSVIQAAQRSSSPLVLNGGFKEIGFHCPLNAKHSAK